MKTCLQCSTVHSDDNSFCPKCGRALVPVEPPAGSHPEIPTPAPQRRGGLSVPQKVLLAVGALVLGLMILGALAGRSSPRYDPALGSRNADAALARITLAADCQRQYQRSEQVRYQDHDAFAFHYAITCRNGDSEDLVLFTDAATGGYLGFTSTRH